VKKLIVNVVSETEYMFKAEGVYSVFRTTVDMLKAGGEVEVRVNSFAPCDIMHAHFPGPIYFALKPFYRGRRILSAHVVPEGFRQNFIFWKQLEPLWTRFIVSSFNSADLIIAVSPAVKRNFESKGVRTPLLFIPNPIDTAFYRRDPELRARGRELLGISAGRPLVLGVGMTVLRKGVDEFVEVARRHPDVSFVWVGGNSFSLLTDGYFAINELISSAPPNMRFAGIFPREKMPELYNAADIFFLPTRQDNFPMVIVEAAACGVPIVLRDLPDFREIFEPGYIPADGIDGFSKAIGKALSEPSFARSQADRSMALAARYDTPAVAAQLVRCYREFYDGVGAVKGESPGTGAP
jgi:1,2-diacylglycerol-3-alpha-glucose alpha-1,2-galactosyltransferase